MYYRSCCNFELLNQRFRFLVISKELLVYFNYILFNFQRPYLFCRSQATSLSYHWLSFMSICFLHIFSNYLSSIFNYQPFVPQDINYDIIYYFYIISNLDYFIYFFNRILLFSIKFFCFLILIHQEQCYIFDKKLSP